MAGTLKTLGDSAGAGRYICRCSRDFEPTWCATMSVSPAKQLWRSNRGLERADHAGGQAPLTPFRESYILRSIAAACSIALARCWALVKARLRAGSEGYVT